MTFVAFRPTLAGACRGSIVRRPAPWRGISFLLIVVSILLSPSFLILAQNDDIEFPPLLDSSDISYFFERNDLDGLHWALSNVFERSQRNPAVLLDKELPQQLIERGGGSTYTTAYKLQMDLEQAQYLVQHLKDDNDETRTFLEQQVIPIYQKVLHNIPPLDQLERTAGLYAFRPSDYEAGIASVYNKALYHTDFDTLRDENTGEPLDLLNPNLDIPNIERQWFEDSSTLGIVVIDDLLSPQALERIRQLLLTSTVWYQTKMPLKFGGYAGAYMDDGLYDKILLQLAMELSQRLPKIIGKQHALKYLWAYKYDSDYTGINIHADEAAVNVNLWITPNEANLDDSSGGLVVFTTKPPADWDFARYNTDTEFVMEHLLKPTNYANVTIPHRQNRAVVFDSALFHHTDKFHFQKGHENRRINLTLLYGNMQKAAKDEL